MQRRLLVGLVAAGLAISSAPDAASAAVAPIAPAGSWRPAPTLAGSGRITVQSPEADFVGAGETLEQSIADIRVQVGYEGAKVEFARPTPDDLFDLTLIGPLGRPLDAATYTNLRSGVGYDPAVGGLRYGAFHRSCNDPLAWVTIDAISWQGGELERIDLHFAYACEPGMPPSLGALSWTVAAPPGAPVPPATVTARGGAVPSVRWDGVPGATGYRITAYVDGQAQPAQVVGAGVRAASTADASPGAHVRFDVQALDADGPGARRSTGVVVVPRGDAARAVANQLYLDLLGRRPSGAELDGWTRRMGAGWTSSRVAATLRGSDEALRREADAAYLVGTARPATVAEREAWVLRRRAGATQARARSIVFTALPGPDSVYSRADELWLDRVSFAVAQRHPSQTDEDGCTRDERRPLVRIACADRIQATAAVRDGIVRQAYRSILGREPDRAGATFWIGRLAAGAPEQAVAVGLAGSAEYQRRAAGAQP